MIMYKNKICIKQTRQGEWIIESDRGQRYDTIKVEGTNTPVSKWWEMNNHSDLREWQKDVLIAELWRAVGELDLFVVYKKGQGYNQPHDICLARWQDVWILSTNEDTWIVKNDSSEFWLDKSTSLGSVLDKDVRRLIYEIYDNI